MNNKMFNYKLSWLIGKMWSVVKWIREWTTDPEVGVQVQMSKKGILEYSVKCFVEVLGMRV